MSLYDLLSRGGLLMIPIGISSILGLALVIERLFSLRRSRIIPLELKKRINKSIESGDLKIALKITTNHASPYARLTNRLLSGLNSTSPRKISEILEEQGRREVHYLNRNVEIIGVLAAVTPLMGLLGTVTGMISVFREVMNQSGIKGINPAMLASGIWEALVTTAAGLSVAIPLYIAYRYLGSKMEGLTLDLEEEIQKLFEMFHVSGGEDK
ncbi:MAG: MotA/TolQ/ExbB proton channel family protein [Deltaproteobacteria bacterium]|nr:MotA/TolQ/ExbB proton channel family protein [Deltaproteobacteria bacterium]